MIVELLMALYFINLVMFSFNSHCIYYCLLLVLNSLVSSLICYFVYGFSWYSLIFCLVYIGGVYVLFIFVSVFNPNDNLVGYEGLGIFVMWVLGFISLLGVLFCWGLINIEFSGLLCTVSEGWFYLGLCLTLVFGFVVLSLLCSFKLNFYR
uniref:NADH dehydrogenase subunit 6 n=1 Tax=Taenia laticollis TaxID=1035110 RepID=N0DLE8_9CEST|nr:NADH dehydrogenase subunit 6 [Taenia laticollis]BAN15640.1 NADH dehydrogenase subunit 6 [Taenia laticollis]